MKKLLILLFSILISFNSYGEWTKLSQNDHAAYFVELDTVKTINGYIYWWSLSNYIKPNEWGDISAKIFFQGECELKSFKYLNDAYYKEPMGQGTPSSSSNIPDEEWDYAPPNSSMEEEMEFICDNVK